MDMTLTTNDFIHSFIKRHEQRCRDDGTLNEATRDAFELLARTYGMLMTIDLEDAKYGVLRWTSLTKTFERQALPFGIASKKAPAPKIKDISDVIREANAGQDEES